MATTSVKVTLHVACSVVEVRFSCLASGEPNTSAAIDVLTAGPANERSGADQTVAPFKDEYKTDAICIDPCALAEEYTLLCAKLQAKCETLAPPVPASSKPKIGPCIEGRREHLEALVKFICSDVPEDKEDIRVGVKNIIFQEANRKSYTSDKQQLKTANVMEDEQVALLWRWEVKKPSCLGEYKSVAMGARSWLKKAQAYLIAHQQAIRLFRGKPHATLQQRQVAAYKKARDLEHPGDPPVALTPSTRVSSPDAIKATEAYVPKDTEHTKCTPTQRDMPGNRNMVPPNDVKSAPSNDYDEVLVMDTSEVLQKQADAKKSPNKARKSLDEDAAAAALGFGKKRSLEKSRGMMQMFVQRAAQKTQSVSPVSGQKTVEKRELSGALQNVDVLEQVKYISEALTSGQKFDVESDWRTLLQGRWKELGDNMKHAHVPGLPPPFSRKSNAPRDPAKLAAMVLQSDEWQGVRTWRRKLLHFPSDGNRPPFYGSFSRRSRIVGSRKVFLKDPNLDYEVLSDEEWEEEPEGEDIIDNDADDEEGAMEEDDEEDGSFMVADGYLSDDERAVHRGSDDEDGFESICATAIAPVGKEKFLHSVLNESVTSYLNALLNAKNNNQVVVMASNPGSVTSIQGQKVRGPDLLEALRMHDIGEDCVRAYEMSSEVTGSKFPAGKDNGDTLESAGVRQKCQHGCARQQNEKPSILAASATVNAPTADSKASVPMQQPVVKKRRRIQAIPDVEPERGGKKPTTARACDIFTVKKATEPAFECSADASCPMVPSSTANEQMPVSVPVASGTGRTAHQCPQPGQGAGMIEKWMVENPDRLRLPGGMAGENAGSRTATPWSPESCLHRQEDRPYRTPTNHAYAAHLSPMKSTCANLSSESPPKAACRDFGRTGNVLQDVGNITTQLHSDAQHIASPCTPKGASIGLKVTKSGLDSGMCRLQLNSKGSTPAAPRKRAIDLCGAHVGDDNDANLQAALLASLHGPAALVEAGGDVADVSDEAHSMLPNRFPGIPDAQRTAVIHASSRQMQHDCQQMYEEVLSHLKACCSNPIQEFNSWRALASYITLLASRTKVPPYIQMKSVLLKMQKWIDCHTPDVPESVVLNLAHASLCDRNQFLSRRAMISLLACATKFLHAAGKAMACTRSSKISLYTFTAHRGMLRTLHRRLAQSLAIMEEAVGSGVTERVRTQMVMSSLVLRLLSKAVSLPGYAGAQLASLLSGSGFQLPGSSFVNILVRLFEATTALEDRLDVNENGHLADDITFTILNIFRMIPQHWQDSAPTGDAAAMPLTPADSVSVLVNLVKASTSTAKGPERQAPAVECLHIMFSVASEPIQRALAADFLTALGQCCHVPGDGNRTRATIMLKKLLRATVIVKHSDSVPVATEVLKLFQCLLCLADQHKTLAMAAWQALMAPHGMPGGLQRYVQQGQQMNQMQAIGQKLDAFREKVSKGNVDKDVSQYVMLEAAFRSLEDQVKVQKHLLGAPLVPQERHGICSIQPKVGLANTGPRPVALKEGVLPEQPKVLNGEEGAVASYNKRRIAPVQVQQGKQSKGAKMLRRAVGK